MDKTLACESLSWPRWKWDTHVTVIYQPGDLEPTILPGGPSVDVPGPIVYVSFAARSGRRYSVFVCGQPPQDWLNQFFARLAYDLCATYPG